MQSQVRFNGPEKVAEAKPGQVHLTHGNPAEVFPAFGFAARFKKICKNKTLRLLIPPKLISLFCKYALFQESWQHLFLRLGTEVDMGQIMDIIGHMTTRSGNGWNFGHPIPGRQGSPGDFLLPWLIGEKDGTRREQRNRWLQFEGSPSNTLIANNYPLVI